MPESIGFCAYDTLCTIQLHGQKSSADTAPLLETCRNIAFSVQQTLSMFDPASELSLLCNGYVPAQMVRVSDMLFDFVRRNVEMAQLTGGAFDPTVGPLVKLWNFLADEPQIPNDAEIAAAMARVGWRHILLDAATQSVGFDVPGVMLDPGAGGKGYALGLVAAHLRKNGVRQAVLNFGNNLYAIGAKESDGVCTGWKTAIRNPDDYNSVVGTVPLCDAGISTSSWYEHCFEKNGQIYHHLLNPATGRPMPLALKSMSVISSNAAFTDFLSTAFFMLGIAESDRLAAELSAATGERIEYVAVLEDGGIHATPGAAFVAAK